MPPNMAPASGSFEIDGDGGIVDVDFGCWEGAEINVDTDTDADWDAVADKKTTGVEAGLDIGE